MIFECLGMSEVLASQYVSDGFGELHSSAARLNYYPSYDPLPKSELNQVANLGDMALHHHTDRGLLPYCCRMIMVVASSV